MNPINAHLNSGNSMGNIMQLLKGNPEAAFSQMMQNPSFARFVNENRGMTFEQVAQKYGINLNQINSILQVLK